MQATTFTTEREGVRRGYTSVVGIDEAGRGPLAGPVVAAAVRYRQADFIIPQNLAQEFARIRDSKQLSPAQREKTLEFIASHFDIGLGIVSVQTIDRLNVLEATFIAMKSALAQLLRKLPRAGRERCLLLVDGNRPIPHCSHLQEAVVGGDGTVKSIAAASIVAKVARDRMMLEYDQAYPCYGFAHHKGYGTRAHMEALRRFGPSPIHRLSFRPVFLSQPENVNKRFADVLKQKNSRKKPRNFLDKSY